MKISNRLDNSVVICTGTEPSYEEIAKLICEAIRNLITQPTKAGREDACNG